MKLETDEWVPAAEAARLLGVSHQRVTTMALEDGSLDTARPWARVLLIGKDSLEAWLNGERQARILPADAKRYVLARNPQALSIHTMEPADVEGWLLGFIIDARPRWSGERQREWVQVTTRRLLTSDAPA